MVENIVIRSGLPRYRNIKQCILEIKKMDSGTAISEWYIRNLCRENKIVYHATGNKSLVNFDNLLQYLGYSEVCNYEQAH